VVVFNNNGVYRGDDVNHTSTDPAPTVFTEGSRYDKLIEAFGGTGYHAEDSATLSAALQQALNARTPALINCIIDPKAGTESGHLTSFN
jgi:oxalyl-CoA decarboxylase